MRLLAEDQFVRLESHLALRAGELLLTPALPTLGPALVEYVMSPGKRIRPQLTVWAFVHARGEAGPVPASLLDLASAWELFHAFLLAHDDIIDNSDTRRLQPALHRRLAELDSGSAVFGSHLALVGGDLLFTAALELLHGLDLPSAAHRAILRRFSAVATTTGRGQALDILQSHAPLGSVEPEALLDEYRWKTAAYTFEGPLVTGALAAGASEGATAALSRFAIAIGQAYQLHNDLVDLAAPTHAGSDLVQGKRTPTLLEARRVLPAAARREFDRALSVAAGGDLLVAESLRQEVRTSGALDATRRLVAGLLDEATAAAREEALPAALGAALVELLAAFRSTYFLPA